MSQSDPEFSRLRAFLWPIHRHEIRKILPMLLMLFFICFNYSILRNIKDSLVVTAKSSGVEAIPFIKVWVLLPMAVLLTVIYTKLSNRFSQTTVIYILISSFLAFFGLFTFVFYPLENYIHPHQLSDYLETVFPAGFKGLIAMFRNWSFTIFYVICELWGSIILTVLFWGFANEITKITEARRFYSMLSIVGSLGSFMAGIGGNYLTVEESWDQTLVNLVVTIIIGGIISMAAFWWMDKNVLNTPEYEVLHLAQRQLPIKKKLSLRESFIYLSKSKYLLCIAAIVVAYNLVINLVEIVWKDQLRQLYSSAVEYNSFMNTQTSAVGLIGMIASLFMATMISRFGWTRTALITPMIMLVTGGGFFAFMLFRNDLAGPVLALTGTTPLMIAVIFGAAQVCLSKACKYSVFDSTKEMAFIPLSHESKIKGKAAIDGVGSRLGKSGGSLIHQGLLMILATVGASAPYVAIILMAVIGLWIVSIRSLGRQFAKLAGKEGCAEIGETFTTPAPQTAALKDPELQTAPSTLTA